MITFKAGAHLINLPNPVWNDTETSGTSVLIKKTRSGKVFTHVKYSELNIFDLTFNRISKENFNAFKTFFNKHVTKSIVYIDMDGNHHSVMILADPLEAEYTNDGNFLNFSVRCQEQ